MKELLYKLRALRDRASRGECKVGICGELGVMCFDETDVFLQTVFAKWPHYNENNAYPIPGGFHAYHKARRKGTLWTKHSEYGRLRWDLLEYLINVVTNKVAADE